MTRPNYYPLFLRCQKTFNKVYRIICCVTCILVIIAQAGFSNYFLVKYLGLSWLSWTIADVIILVVFAVAFIISHSELRITKTILHTENVSKYGELPMGYLAWSLYSIIISIKFGIIYGPDFNIVDSLTDNTTIGPNYVKTSLAVTSVVFLFLVLTHNDAESNSFRSNYINSVTRQVTIDILDTTQFMDVLFVSEYKIMISYSYQIIIIIIGCINIILPTMLLVGLSYSRFGKANLTTRFILLHGVVYNIFINVPMLVMRSLISHKHDIISVFLIKNALTAAYSFKDLLKHFITKFEPDDKGHVSRSQEQYLTDRV